MLIIYICMIWIKITTLPQSLIQWFGRNKFTNILGLLLNLLFLPVSIPLSLICSLLVSVVEDRL